MAAPTTVKSLITHAMKTVLEDACINNVPGDDPSRAARVVIGRFTGSITRDKIVLEVHAQHPLGPEQGSHRGTQGTQQPEAKTWDLPAETIGGSKFRWERGTVQVRCHLRLEREDAVEIIEAVRCRVRQAIEDSNDLIGLQDDFGNMVHTIEVTDDYAYTNEAGNPSTERAFIDWRALLSYRRTRV